MTIWDELGQIMKDMGYSGQTFDQSIARGRALERVAKAAKSVFLVYTIHDDFTAAAKKLRETLAALDETDGTK